MYLSVTRGNKAIQSPSRRKTNHQYCFPPKRPWSCWLPHCRDNVICNAQRTTPGRQRHGRCQLRTGNPCGRDKGRLASDEEQHFPPIYWSELTALPGVYDSVTPFCYDFFFFLGKVSDSSYHTVTQESTLWISWNGYTRIFFLLYISTFCSFIFVYKTVNQTFLVFIFYELAWLELSYSLEELG